MRQIDMYIIDFICKAGLEKELLWFVVFIASKTLEEMRRI